VSPFELSLLFFVWSATAVALVASLALFLGLGVTLALTALLLGRTESD